MESTIQSINLISTNPNIRNGRPCIDGTGLEVSVIAIAKTIQDRTPEQLAEDYDISLAKVYAALSYYYLNKSAIDASIKEREEYAEQKTYTSEFWQPKSLEMILSLQQVEPIDKLAELQADFWPEDEQVDDFVAFIDKQREV